MDYRVRLRFGAQLDVVANNVANVNTTGFKNSQMVFEEYLMPVASDGDLPRGADRKLSYVEDKSTWQDFSVGAIQNSGNQLDVAIDGQAFFAVETPQGIRYTRNGQFQIDPQGRLVTDQGYPVIGNGGQITFAPNETDFTIAEDGTISTSEGIRRSPQREHVSRQSRPLPRGSQHLPCGRPAADRDRRGRPPAAGIDREVECRTRASRPPA